MKTQEQTTHRTERAGGEQDITFDEVRGTLTIGVDKNFMNQLQLKEVAASRGGNEKEKIPLTIIGSDTAEKILASFEKPNPAEKQKRRSKIRVLAYNTAWIFQFKPEFYYIRKNYNDADPNDPSTTIPEIREPIVRVVDTENPGTILGTVERNYPIRFRSTNAPSDPMDNKHQRR